jgi:RNA polymerase sigma factor (sigma-70 family)
LTLNDLRAVRYAHLQVRSLNERIARLRSALEGCTARPLSPLPQGGTTARDKLGDDVARLLELEERRRKQIIDLEMLLEKVEKWIDELPPQQAQVMRLRYVDGLDWRQVARRASYTSEHCRKINAMACRKLDAK